MRGRILLVLAVAALAYWLGRQSLPELRERLAPPSPHEAYARRLQDAGLTDAALGRLWLRAAERSLAAAPRVEAPFREEGYLDPSRPEAVAYRFPVRAGERLTIRLSLDPPSNALFFLDLFRSGEGVAVPRRVLSADRGGRVLEVEPSRSGEYTVRVQPELLRGGRYTLTAATSGTMTFPVAGAGVGDVHSFFGDPRDGGARDHHGIDIFAPRNTPVVAAVAGRVARVRTTPVGGRVVWLRDEGRNQSIYYAHLEEQLVREGQRVVPGDTLGRVGNSGNARTTPPHLHFGIYRRGTGPLDPLPFVRPQDRRPPGPTLPSAVAGRIRRVDSPTVLRAGPGPGARQVARLERHAPVRVAAVLGDWLRVELDDGRRGFLPAASTTPPAPLREAAVATATSLRQRPDPDAAEVARLEPGERVQVLGRLGDHLYVRAGSRVAWLPRESAP